MSVPTNLAILHRSFVRSPHAENRSPRTVEAYSFAIDQLAEHFQGRDDIRRPPPSCGASTSRAISSPAQQGRAPRHTSAHT